MSSIRGLLACCVIAAASPAGAQPASPAGVQPGPSAGVRLADALFRKGRERMAAGQYAEACEAFAQSQKLAPQVTTLLNLAGCREKSGQIATAQRLFAEAEAQTRPESDEAMAQLHQVALGHVARLEPRVSKLTIRVWEEGARKLPGLEIYRDGERIPAEMWNQGQPIDGGTYTVVARAPGAQGWSERVTVAAEADTRTVDVPLLQPVPRPPESPQSAQPRGRSLGLPLGVGAGAVALLGGALGFALWGNSTYDEAKAEMVDQARRDSLETSANHKRYVAQGLAVAGVAGAGVAVWLYLRQSGGRAEASATRAGLRLTPTASGIGVIGRF